MNIGDAAEATGLPVKTIRYYEDIGLIAPERRSNGYRDFGDETLRRLRFLAQARHLGFSLDECRQLIGLYCDQTRASRDVRVLAEAHLADLRDKIRQLHEMEERLQGWIAACPGNDDPHCSILDGLSGKPPAPCSGGGQE